MKRSAMLLIFATLTAARGTFSQDADDAAPVPTRTSARGNPFKPSAPPPKKDDAPSTKDAPPAEPLLNDYPSARVSMDLQRGNYEDLSLSEQRVKRELDRYPTYENDAKPDAPGKTATAPSAGRAQVTVTAGRGTRTGTAQAAPVDPAPGAAPLPIEDAPTTRTPYVDPNDLTADKPGTVLAQNPNLFEDMIPAGPVNSRAKKCYMILAALKANIETISRCLDNRGKENARLVHTSEVVSKNISDLAAIWVYDDEFRDRCATIKRQALLFNDELNQQPWQWAQVRWSFDTLLKSAVGFREYCREIADKELRPIAVVDKKTGLTFYQDQPDPVLSTVEARHAAALKATQDEISKRRRFEEAISNSKKEKVKSDLDSR